MPHLHLIGAGGIGVSAIGRYYKELGWSVSWSDASEGEITRDLQKEGFSIFLWHDAKHLPTHTDLVVHTEGIFIASAGISHGEKSRINGELEAALALGIPTLSYPQALARISNQKQQIAIAGSHGKSSTTSMIGVMLAGTSVGGSTIVGTKLSAFNGKNIHIEEASPWFAIEACEYKRHFLEYTPTIAVITNIDVDHLDYYKDEADYLSAFVSFVERTKSAVVLSREDAGCRSLYEVVSESDRNRLTWYWVDGNGWSCGAPSEPLHEHIPHLTLKVPGEHLRLDANLAYVVGEITHLPPETRIERLEQFGGAWRRSETVWITLAGNRIMSDYGHHPSELAPTLNAIRETYPDKHFVVAFQPHQAARTRALLAEFSTCFGDVDELIISDIYLSRDTEEDIVFMTIERLIESIRPHQKNVHDGQGLSHTLDILRTIDHTRPNECIFLLQGAGSIDELRYGFSYQSPLIQPESPKL